MSANDLIALNNIIEEAHAGRAPNLKDSDFFEIFAAEQVLKDFSLTDDEVESGLVGGPDDAGLDGIYFLVDKLIVTDETIMESKKVRAVDLVLLQATRKQSFDENKINKLLVFTDDLLNLTDATVQGTYNPAVLAAIERFKTKYKEVLHARHEITVSYHYVSKGDSGTVNQALSKKAEVAKNKVVDWLSAAKCNFKFTGATELLALARKQPKHSYALQLSGTPVSPKGQNAFIGLVPIAEYASFLSHENGDIRTELFVENVRDFQGKVKVNRAIQGTLEKPEEDEDFWWLNNGVTILSSGASHSGTILTIEDPQVVNGLQTSRLIHEYLASFRGRGSTTDSRQVLVRVISVSDQKSQDRIIRATNSQTAMPDYQLYATEKLQRDIEDTLRGLGLFYDRRRNYHKNRGRPIAKIVTPLYLAQSIIAIELQRPNDARASPSSVLSKDRKKIFRANKPLQVYTVCARLMRQVDDYLKTPGLEVDRPTRSNIRFYIGMVVSCDLTQKAEPAVKQIKEIDPPVEESVLSNAYELVHEVYQSRGGTDRTAKGGELLADLKRRMASSYGNSIASG